MKIRRRVICTTSEPVPSRFSLASFFLVLGLSSIFILTPSRVLAVDGRIEYRTNHQEGRAGVEAYETDTEWQIFNLGQGAKLSDSWFLRVDATARRERLWGSSQFSEVTTDKKVLIPNFNLTFRKQEFRLSFHGRAGRIDQVRTGLPDQRDENFDFGAWLYTTYRWLEFDANAQQAVAWRYAEGSDREIRNNQVNFLTRAHLTEYDELRYKFSRTQQDAVSFNTESTFTSNQVQYRGSHLFDGNRGDFAIDALYNHFNQVDEIGDLFGQQYVLPAFGGFVLDDTPEYLDPLEGDPIPEPALYDRDRSTPTQINLGDNAPVVRDYGGDYRNIILDFGDTQEMSALILYIDRIVRFPQLINWALYVSDSADGRDWGTALSPASYTITYTEFETGRQGWVVQLAEPINHRRIKMVNTKLGPTEPDILVTELELYQTSVTATPDFETTTVRKRVEADVGYRIVPAVRVRYSGSFDKRTYDAQDRDLEGISNLVGANWEFSNWMLSGQYDTYTLKGPSRRDTDASTKSISLMRRRDTALYGMLSWNQTIDNSFSAKYTTSSLTADVSWRIAPLLTYNQKVTYGVRSAQDLSEDSDSWALISEIRSNPKPNINLDFRRSDRWVSQQFGTGFTTFNDTEVNLGWTIFPYLYYVSQVVYQVRDEDDWLIRNSLSWTPLPGGSMVFQFHVRDNQDTRTDYLRRGGGGTVTWKPRPRLNLSAGAEKYYEKVRGERGYPVSYQFRGYWTF
jgi:hypothetical protein